MNKVIIINLNGNAYQLDETGYEALRAYLDDAAQRLRDNPDRAEILLKRFGLFTVEPPDDHVLWYEVGERSVSVTATPLDVAEPLRDFRRRMRAAWIFTSATLSVGGRFEHFTRQMGRFLFDST